MTNPDTLDAQLDAQALAKVQMFNLMKARGLKQRELATLLNVSPQYVSRMLHEEGYNVSLNRLAEVFFVLGERLEITSDMLLAKERVSEANSARLAKHHTHRREM